MFELMELLYRMYVTTQRIYLTEECEQVLVPWYEGLDEIGVQNVNQMVDEVCTAWKERKKSGTTPDTSHWADNQCALFGILSKI